MGTIFQSAAPNVTPQITQSTVVAILLASTLVVAGLLGLIGIFAWRTREALIYGNFFLKQDGLSPVEGRVDYDAPTRKATFTPDEPLENGKTYQATITANVQDQAGNRLTRDHAWHFTVIAQST